MDLETREKARAGTRIALWLAGSLFLSACADGEGFRVLGRSPAQLQDDDQTLAPCGGIAGDPAIGCPAG